MNDYNHDDYRNGDRIIDARLRSKISELINLAMIANGSGDYCVFFEYPGHVDWIGVRLVHRRTQVVSHDRHFFMIWRHTTLEEKLAQLDWIARLFDAIIHGKDLPEDNQHDLP